MSPAAKKQTVKAATGVGAAAVKTVQWRGLDLALPSDKLSVDTVFLIGEIEDGSIRALVQFFNSVLGTDGFAAVRAKLVEDQVAADDFEDVVMGEVLTAVLDAYGMQPGEAGASATS